MLYTDAHSRAGRDMRIEELVKDGMEPERAKHEVLMGTLAHIGSREKLDGDERQFLKRLERERGYSEEQITAGFEGLER